MTVERQRWVWRDGVLVSPLLEARGLAAGMTTRALGSMGSAVTPAEEQERNRASLAARLGFPTVVRVKQVHGAKVVPATEVSRPWPEADGLWADAPGTLLGVVVADCVPVLVADDEGHIGAAHAGWQGTSFEVARHLVRALIAAGARPERMVAALGPSIGPCCYTIDEQRAETVRSRLGPLSESALYDGRMDLWAANLAQLQAEGVTTVEAAAICTRCGGEDLWSFRGREMRPDYGSCLAYIGWPAP